jgi:outer membrane immunogenic protein
MGLMQKQIWLAGVALAAVACASAASAADLPTKKAPPAPMMPIVVPFSWTGFYVGVTAGANWGSGSTELSGSFDGAPLAGGYFPGSLGHSNADFEGGGEVGYNYQINNFVIGIEDDLQWLSGTNSLSFTGSTVPALGGPLNTYASYKLDWLGTTRARLGFATMDQGRLLLFVSGGLAYGGGSSSLSVTGPAGNGWYGSSGSTQVGWTVGGGAEYAFTNNWSVKAEYLYYQLSSFSYASNPNSIASAAGFGFNAKATPEGSIARVGVNYKF